MNKNLNHDNATRAPSTSTDRGGTLRGPTPIRVGPRFWRIVSGLLIVSVVVALVVTSIAATSYNARISRMQHHGIAVTLRVDQCTGNLSGSGTNIASYSCVGSYDVTGEHFREPIAAMTTYHAPGTQVRAVVDPARHSTVELASALRRSSASVKSYLASFVLLVLLVVLVAAFVRARGRRRQPGAPPSEE